MNGYESIYRQILSDINADGFVTYLEGSDALYDSTDISKTFFKDTVGTDDIVNVLQLEAPINKVLEPSAFDANPTYRDREQIGQYFESLLFFREAMYLNEKQASTLLEILEKAKMMGDSTALMMHIKKLYDDAARLVAGANLQSERMRASLLCDGTFKVTSKDGKLEYSSGFRNSEWEKTGLIKLTGTDEWKEQNKATMNPVRDIAKIIEKKRLEGVIIKHLVMTTATLTAMSNATIINTQLENSDYVGALDVQKYIENRLNIKIHLYDKIFNDTDGKDKPMFKDNVVTFLPDKKIGKTYYSLTPEQRFDKLSQNVNSYGMATHRTVAPNISVRMGFEPMGSNPLRLYTMVSQMTAPIVESKREVTILEVKAAED